jgi:glutamyl-tRNA reductase
MELRLSYLIVGVSHRSGTAALRERLIVDEAGQTELLADLRAAGLGQGLVLSTCDRSELHTIAGDPTATAALLKALLARRAGVAPADIAAQGYELTGAAALRHLCAVASALDSVVIGEPQVLGQIKESQRLSVAAGMMGAQLAALLRAAYAVAKRVRSETAIGERPVSIAAAAIQMARGVHGDLARCSALLLGGGEMGELMAEHLRQAGLARIVVVHRTSARAALIAHRLQAHWRPLEELAAALADADIVISALGDERQAVTAAAIKQALKERRQRPMLCIDSAIPGDIEAAVHDLDGAFRFDLGDLERLALAGQTSRSAAAAPAWAIVDSETAAFAVAQTGREAVPAVVALRRHFEALRDQVVADNPGAAAADVARLLVNRLLHAPSAALRDLATDAAVDAGGELMAIERLLSRLFGLDVSDRAIPSGDEEKDA